MIGKYCGKYLGYTHMSGTKAYCGDDVVTHIIYCSKCKISNEKKKKKDRKEMIKSRIAQIQEFIKNHRSEIDKLKRELNFMNGHYDKSWEEEYAKGDKDE